MKFPKITKAVIPAAGLGTRFLPQTKAMPKEMLPIIDKPIIQYVVEEAVAAGITDIIIVTGWHKRSIEDHFDHQYDLEKRLRQTGKPELADELSRIAELANFVYLRQKGSYGNGTPILNAAHLLGDEPFMVLWADEFVKSHVPRAQQLIEAYQSHGAPVIPLIPIEPAQASSYGVPIIADDSNSLLRLGGLVEKPGPDKAPSPYAVVGGYILTPDIVEILSSQQPDDGGEIYLAAAIHELCSRRPVYGHIIKGKWHDTGDKQKYLEAILDMALDDSWLGPRLRDYLAKRLHEAA